MSRGTQAVCKAVSFEEHAVSSVKPCHLYLLELSDYAGVASETFISSSIP